MNTVKQFVGEWWVPGEHPGFKKEMKGTLYLGDDEITLELYWYPSDSCMTVYHQNEVLWGNAECQYFSLFNCKIKEHEDRAGLQSRIILEVRFVLVGNWLHSLDETVFDTCVVKFPYLRNWACQHTINWQNYLNHHILDLNFDTRKPLVSTVLDDNIRFYLIDTLGSFAEPLFKIVVEEDTALVIECTEGLSVRKCIQLVSEFSQFLSIALFAEQSPVSLVFKGSHFVGYSPKDISRRDFPLLFSPTESQNPKNVKLIKFDKLKDKVPSMLNLWHENYKTHAPISNYLVKSINNQSSFDAPDFLMIVQSLDGFHKRFLNKKEVVGNSINAKKSKDIRKLEQELDQIILKFESVDIIKKCNFDTKQIRDTRDYYTHFLPDEEVVSRGLRVAHIGEELISLTQTCKILLTCCILDMLGLSAEEINECCKHSPLEFILPNNLC